MSLGGHAVCMCVHIYTYSFHVFMSICVIVSVILHWSILVRVHTSMYVICLVSAFIDARAYAYVCVRVYVRVLSEEL